MIRPGAELTPSTVWQELQSPDICASVIARSRVPETTFARKRVAMEAAL
jgi:hypothetical protein